MFLKSNSLKTIIFVFFLFFFSYSFLYAGKEGRLFLDVQTISCSPQVAKASLEKIFVKGIKSKNIHEAILKLRDLDNKMINIDVTEDIKIGIEKKKEEIQLRIQEEYCFVNCHRSGYPQILVHYGFNSPPVLNLISPEENEKTEKNEISFVWEGVDYDGLFLEFRLEINTEPLFEKDNVFQSKWLSEKEARLRLEHGFYYWRIIARDNSKFKNVVISEPQFFEILTEAEEIPEKEEGEKDYSEEKKEEETQEEVEREKPGEKVREPNEEEEEEVERTNLVISEGEIAQLMHNTTSPSAGECRYRYNTTYKTLERIQCTLNPPELILVTHTSRGYGAYEKRVIGAYNPKIKIFVDVYECFLWPFCYEKYIQTFYQEKEAYTMNLVYIDDIPALIFEYRTGSNNTFQAFILSYEDFTGSNIYTKYYLNTEITFRDAWDGIVLYSPKANILTVPQPVTFKPLDSKNLYRFPFHRLIGVTQWYGYTAYQSPHTGIDFGSYKEPIYAIGDGYIQNVGWYHGSHACISGGNFISIEHDKGMYSVYLHLDNYKKGNGQNWKIGERVLEDDLIGISGNTGVFNCQPLGYHLHFELRENKYPLSHTDPVPHIDIDWYNVPTLGHEQHPGRLTGNNPHPTY